MFVGAVMAVLLGLYNVQLARGLKMTSLEDLMTLTFGFLNIYNIQHIVPVMVWMMPLVLLVYMLGEQMASDVRHHAVFVFTRTERRKAWLLIRCRGLFVDVVLYILTQMIVVGVIGFICGSKMTADVHLRVVFDEFVFVALSSYLVIAAVNLMTLRMNAIMSASLVLTIHVSCLFVAGFEPYQRKLLMVMPFIQEIYAWHADVSAFSTQQAWNSFHITGFTTTFSLVYLVLATLAVLGWGLYQIERKDFI